jgi:RHS repeat-associated protein
VRSGVEVSERRYRYTGKERDDETGFQIHGLRYYVPWLGRWTTSDPIGLQGGLNGFGYCRGDPVGKVDPEGTEDNKPTLHDAIQQGAHLGMTSDAPVPAREGASSSSAPKPAEPARPQVSVPHFSGVDGSAFPQVKSFESTGSDVGDAALALHAWNYNYWALAWSAGLAAIEGADQMKADVFKAAGAGSTDVLAFEHVSMLHSRELAGAVRSIPRALRMMMNPGGKPLSLRLANSPVGGAVFGPMSVEGLGGSGAARQSPGMALSLGARLETFAQRTGSQGHEWWDNSYFFDVSFRRAARQYPSIHFNLEGFSYESAALAESWERNSGLVTNAEFRSVITSPYLRGKTTFYDARGVVSAEQVMQDYWRAITPER